MENTESVNVTSQESYEVPDLSTLNAAPVETEANNSQDPNVHTNDANEPNPGAIEIDPRFKDLPLEEGTIRTLQSQKDRAIADYTKLMKDFEEKDKIASLFGQMVEDEDLLMSFIREIKPDLIKPIDLGTQLKEQLQKEFGEDFKPTMSRDEAEREDPFGKDAKYYMRVDALKTKLLNEGSQENTTVKEYLAKKAQADKLEAAKYEAEREAAKVKYKMADEEVKAVSDWWLKQGFDELVAIHRFLRKFPTRNPNINQVPGSPESAKSDREKFLKEVFSK